MQLKHGFLSKLSSAQLCEWQRWLSEDKQKQLKSLPLFRQRQLICGEGFARLLLSERFSIDPQSVKISFSSHGKPLVEGAWFSISHSRDVVVCAVDSTPIGIDVEKIRPIKKEIIQKLSPVQQNYVQHAPTGKEDEYFFRVWTAAEAYIKCLDKAWHAIFEAPLPTKDAACYSFSLQFAFDWIAPDYLLAICRQVSERSERW